MTAAVFSAGIAAIEHLSEMLGVEIEHKTWFGPMHFSEVYGWGRKKNTRWPRLYAARHSIPYASLEDGFIRSYGLGINGSPTLSVVRDYTGIYYDSTRPSDLELMISASVGHDDKTLNLAAVARRAIVDAGITKYSTGAEFMPSPEFLSSSAPKILVVDQTFGDMSVIYGSPRGNVFPEMLKSAAIENPGCEIFIKTHPDVLSGKKSGYFGLDEANKYGAKLLASDVNPYSLFPYFERVYTVTSQMGFEALLAGKRVTCFGVPFYSGWGLTDDRSSCGRRGVARTLDDVFICAYMKYSSYLNPLTKGAGTIFDVISYVMDMKMKVG